MNFKIVGLFALFFLGCNNTPVYEKIYNKKALKEPIKCFEIISNNDIASFIVKKNSFIKSLHKKSCPVKLKITSHFVTTCTSATTKALGSDFDGFLRFDIVKNRPLYRIQRDFKGCLNENVVDSLVKIIKKRLKFVSADSKRE